MNFLRIAERIGAVAKKIASHATVLLFIIMTLIVWAQIFFRFVLGGGIVWSEEIAKFLMVWMALLGASVLFAEGGHIAINYFIGKLRFLRYILMSHAILSAVLFILLIYYGIDYAAFGYKSIATASGIRKFWPYLAIPVGGGFLLVQAFTRFVHLLKTDDKTIRAEEEARARNELLAAAE
jgi:TRAP-type C4-dicarboxylate transport system permease small subunit